MVFGASLCLGFINPLNFGILDSFDTYVWVIAFVLYDLSYYWLHGCHHKLKYYGPHVVHHHGEEFNLSTALRQTGTDFSTNGYSVAVVVSWRSTWNICNGSCTKFNLSVWVHTEHRWLGIIDYILVTPSNHRIHHAQNKEYVDANYGVWPIIWTGFLVHLLTKEKI